MIGPVSGTGRAMMASLQQAIQKGMPPDQAVQYVKSMAMQGVAPLTDLYSMMNQFQRLKQQQVQPPQTPPTIRDQLNIMDQQQQMQGGIAGMQAPAPQGSPMDRGLGAIDAGRMEYPQFAGGGIVAFQEGGDVEDEISQLEEALQADDYIKSGVGGSLGRAIESRTMPMGYVQRRELERRLYELRQSSFNRGPSTRGRYRPDGVKPISQESPIPTGSMTTPYSSPSEAGAAFDRQIATARQNVPQGVPTNASLSAIPARQPEAVSGGAGRRQADPFANLRKQVNERTFESIEDTYSPEEKKRIEKTLAGLSAEKQDAARMALAQAGFSMAAAASRAGRQRTTGLGALAEGALGGLQQYAASQKEIRQTERELNKEMASLRRYQDEVARGERKENRAFEEAKQRDILDLESKQLAYQQGQDRLAMDLRIAQIRSAGDVNMSDYLMRQVIELDKITDPVQRQAAEAKLNRDLANAERVTSAVTAGGAGAGARRDLAVVEAVNKERESREYQRLARIASSDSSSETAKEKARMDMARLEREARDRTLALLGGSGGGVSPVTSAGYVPTTSGW